MKKTNRSNPTTKFALFAGALALTAFASKSDAQSSVDALLNKLEQKGVLTVDEARELKAENATNSVADINKVVNGKFTTADWVNNYKLYGDIRLRYDQVDADLPAFKNSGGTVVADNNIRFRYRLRAGITMSMKDDVQAGFRIGSDDTGKGSDAASGNPLSNNSTLLGNSSKKPLWVDAAFGKWTAVNTPDCMVAGTLGKMDNPFVQSGMVFDPDFTPEGAALQASYKFDSNNTLLINGGGFIIDQFNSRGPYFYGAQGIWNSTWTPHIATSAGVAGYDVANLRSIAGIVANGATPYDSNIGNTMAGSRFVSDFNPVVVSGSMTYTLDSFPLYPGAFPIRFAGEYMKNPAAARQNEGWWLGATVGKAAKKGTWDVSYRYQKLEADAWWDQLVDDDNIATVPTSAVAGNATGGTNIKGHLIKANYAIFDSLTFSFTAYANTLINNPIPAAKKTGALHVMADLMWKF